MQYVTRVEETVESFGEEKQRNYKQGLADTAGVSVADISLEIVAGSLLIIATIRVGASSDYNVATVQENVNTIATDKEAASIALGIDVTEIEPVTTSVVVQSLKAPSPPPPSPPPSPPLPALPPSSGESSGSSMPIVVIAAGLGGGVVLVTLLIAFYLPRKKAAAQGT